MTVFRSILKMLMWLTAKKRGKVYVLSSLRLAAGTLAESSGSGGLPVDKTGRCPAHCHPSFRRNGIHAEFFTNEKKLIEEAQRRMEKMLSQHRENL